MTLVGFAVLMSTMVSLRLVPGLTRHTGDYGTNPATEVSQ
jgi:hypothetical protein